MSNKILHKTTEPAFLRNAFLNHYLFADVLFTAYCTPEEMRYIYDRYAAVFGVHNRIWLDEIWNIISSDLFSLADNAVDFNRLMRLSKQYPDRISDTENYVLSQKVFAIQSKTELLPTQEDASLDTVLGMLVKKASGGHTHCTALLAFLEYHGILVQENRAVAEKRIRIAACWNHILAILMGARYSDSPAAFHSKLCTLLGASSSKTVRLYLKDELEIPDDTKQDKITLALDYAFCQGVLQPDKAHPDVMRIIGSTVLGENSKYELIRSLKNAESLSLSLPLGVTQDTEIRFNATAFDTSAEERQAETEHIHANLSMLDLRDTALYKPLLFVCNDEFVLDYYREAIRSAFAGAPVSYVRPQEGDACNLSRSTENLFIAAMQKHGDRNVVVVIDHCEMLSQETRAELVNHLHAASRKHYAIGSTPQIEMDLSGVLPILFASEIPDSAVAECCDVIMAAELSLTEFHTVIANALERKKAEFKLASLTMASDVPAFLFDYSHAAVTDLLNKAICRLRAEDSHVCITVPVLQGIVDKYDFGNNHGGFWKDSTV